MIAGFPAIKGLVGLKSDRGGNAAVIGVSAVPEETAPIRIAPAIFGIVDASSF
jgi:hypothetical protein